MSLAIGFSMLLLFTLNNHVSAQNTISIQMSWEDNAVFSAQKIIKDHLGIPYVNHTHILKGASPIVFEKAQLTNLVFENISTLEKQSLKNTDYITDKISLNAGIGYQNNKSILSYSFIPLIKQNGVFKKLVSAQLTYRTSPYKNQKSLVYTNTSVLSTGNWYKFSVQKTGVYKITYDQLVNAGINPSSINPQNIGLFAHDGKMLSTQNNQYTQDDLSQIAIKVVGENDGAFDLDDYILFYAQEPTRWMFNSVSQSYTHENHLFSNESFVFLSTQTASPKRIEDLSAITDLQSVTINSFTDKMKYEIDLFSLIKSGQSWVGEHFSSITNYSFDMQMQNPILSSPVSLRIKAVSRSIAASSFFTVKANGQDIGNLSIGSVSGVYWQDYAKEATFFNDNIFLNNAAVKIDLGFQKANASAEGWLDFIELNYQRALSLSNSEQLYFEYLKPNATGLVQKFVVSDAGQMDQIWNVTDFYTPKGVHYAQQNQSAEFKTKSDSAQKFIAFTANGVLKPNFIKKVNNQNLHGIQQADYVIVTHPLFIDQANELADFHANNAGFSTAVISTEEVYNEFSAGAQDISAIKHFNKMLYDRAIQNGTNKPRYLLLFGDASYDLKDRNTQNTNFVPVYQSKNYLTPADGSGIEASYLTDDYFGLLDDLESDKLTDIVDVGIGRLMVKNTLEAQQMVDKIKAYYHSNALGDWRNVAAFVADDEDGNIHMSQSNQLSNISQDSADQLNLKKVFFDAFLQQTSSSGQLYPDVNEQIQNAMKKGVLALSYTGHGGETGWGHEKVLTTNEINAWTNLNNMPVMITATCEFSRFDDPERTSAGELCLLNPEGGVIGMLTTTRLVFAGPNFLISKAFIENAFRKNANNENPRLGDLVRLTKVFGPKVVNTRNFSLLGDPAVQLALPKLKVYTTACPDTLKGLSLVTIKGFIGDDNGQIQTDFNGVLYPKVFDKAKTIQTLNNDGVGVFSFSDQSTLLFNGKASVTNGEFEFSFVVPKDIGLNFGAGRISYYAENGLIDAAGVHDDFLIGGIDTTALADQKGPEIELFLNNRDFVFGGITNPSPKLLADIEDENGINTTGNGIGHDITLIIDEDSPNKIILNEEFQNELDSYQKGSVQYDFSDLPLGKHTLRLKAWDVHNNSGEGYLEFYVTSSEDLALDHILNYPNPFTTQTSFFFEHNKPASTLSIKIEIYTVSGRRVKTIHRNIFSEGFRVGPIDWNARDDFEQPLAKGVYVYTLKVISQKGEIASEREKLVILK